MDDRNKLRRPRTAIVGCDLQSFCRSKNFGKSKRRAVFHAQSCIAHIRFAICNQIVGVHGGRFAALEMEGIKAVSQQ